VAKRAASPTASGAGDSKGNGKHVKADGDASNEAKTASSDTASGAGVASTAADPASSDEDKLRKEQEMREKLLRSIKTGSTK